jgi:hypothetical protein
MADAGEAVATADFEESQGRTRLTLRRLFPSRPSAGRGARVGMEAGMRVTLDQLDPLVCAERVSARPALAALLPSALVKRTRARLAKKSGRRFFVDQSAKSKKHRGLGDSTETPSAPGSISE